MPCSSVNSPLMLPLMEGLKEINYVYRKNSIIVE